MCPCVSAWMVDRCVGGPVCVCEHLCVCLLRRMDGRMDGHVSVCVCVCLDGWMGVVVCVMCIWRDE